MLKTIIDFILYTHKVKAHVYQMILIVFYSITSIIASFSLGNLTQNVINLDASAIKNYLLVYIFLYLLCVILEWYIEKNKIKLLEKLKQILRSKIVQKILSCDYSSLNKLESGDLINRLNIDCGAAVNASNLLISAFRHIIVTGIMLIGMFFVNWKIAFAFLLPFPIIFLWGKTSSLTQNKIMVWKQSLADMTSETLDYISHRETIKVYSAQDQILNWADITYKRYQKTASRTLSFLYSLTVPSLFFNVLPVIFCAAAGGQLLFIKQIQISEFVGTMLIAQTATQSLLSLPGIIFNIPASTESIKRIWNILDLPSEKTQGLDNTLSNSTVIEFDNVSFGYTDIFMKNMSLKINSGQKVALVGPSGSGKSTLANLITGLYRPTNGLVKLWGVDINNWNLEFLRANIGIMQQNTAIITGTIYDNIIIAKENATFEQVENAANKAQLFDWIMTQPEKWNTAVGERGSFLSEGLKQRIGLARVFLQNAPLIILDEPTASLDAENENKILEAINALTDGKTLITIAHKLNTIKHFDVICLIDNGTIYEKGTHEELIKTNGKYCNLYSIQQGGQTLD